MTAGGHPGPEAAVLVVDATGRGHALCAALVGTDPRVRVFYGPGCDLIEDERIVPVPAISLTDPQTVLDFLEGQPVEFVMVANIEALSRGFVDVLRAAGHAVVGPTRDAAQLEASKSQGKRFCLDHGLPTAAHHEFTDPDAAVQHVLGLPGACVVKEDGLTPDGDGAVVCETAAEAVAAVRSFARRPADDFRIVVEERLHGPEISVFALLDGEHYLLFPTALDYKRTLEGDEGGNCDGMGSISPHPLETDQLRADIERVLLAPLVRGLRAEALDYRGFVFLGVMLTDRGPQVLEINTRFGDSEAEAVLPGVVTPFAELCRAVLTGSLDRQRLETDGLARCSVALTQGSTGPGDVEAPGWPFGRYRTGQPVTGLADVDRTRATVFLANVHRDTAGRPVTAGGRVLHVVGVGSDIAEARCNAYSQIERVHFPGMRVRTDIGDLALPAGAAAADSPRHPQPLPEAVRV